MKKIMIYFLLGLISVPFFVLFQNISSAPATLIQKSLILSPSRFYADSYTTKGFSGWGNRTGLSLSGMANKRTTTFWGQPGSNCNSDAGYNYPQTISKIIDGISQSIKVNLPMCSLGIAPVGPSYEADIYFSSANAFQHFIRAEALPGNTGGFLFKYGSGGQNGAGANANIHGIYSTFNPEWIMMPFSAATSDYDKLSMSIRSEQRLNAISTLDSTKQQIQQNLRINLINTHCYQNNFSSSSTFCQLELNVKLYIAGKNAFTPNSDGYAFGDAGQGGLLVMLGPVNSDGLSTSATNSVDLKKYPIWTSNGKSSQVGTSSTLNTFQLDISFNQFKNIVNILTKNDPAKYYGAEWANPNKWYLINAGYGQELYNASPASTLFIESVFKNLEVTTIISRSLTVQKLVGNSLDALSGSVNAESFILDTSKSSQVGNYAEGKTILLKANPASGYEFQGWDGCQSVSATNECMVNVDSDKLISAKFSKVIIPIPVPRPLPIIKPPGPAQPPIVVPQPIPVPRPLPIIKPPGPAQPPIVVPQPIPVPRPLPIIKPPGPAQPPIVVPQPIPVPNPVPIPKPPGPAQPPIVVPQPIPVPNPVPIPKPPGPAQPPIVVPQPIPVPNPVPIPKPPGPAQPPVIIN